MDGLEIKKVIKDSDPLLTLNSTSHTILRLAFKCAKIMYSDHSGNKYAIKYSRKVNKIPQIEHA